jgi:hypothetical protein
MYVMRTAATPKLPSGNVLEIQMAAAQIWIYSLPNEHYLIAKRRPFSYQIPIIDNIGEQVYQLVSGVQIDLPKWEHVVKDAEGQVWAKFQDNIYNVTDL